MSAAQSQMQVDKSSLRTNQISIILVIFIGFLIGTDRGGHVLVGLTALSMMLGTLFPEYGPYRVLYKRVLRPLGILKPDIEADDPRPHRFALGLGSAVAWLGFLGLLAGQGVLGWTLSWVVLVLALVNLTVNFCLGCFVYYQLGRLGLLTR